MSIIYTIGYGGTGPDTFFDYLDKKGIDLVIDVRTRARGFIQSYSAPTIGRKLAEKGIEYIHDTRLGGFEDIDPVEFRAAIKRVLDASKDMRVCLMCSERDPHKCHRYSKLSPKLEENGAEMEHLVIGAEPKRKKSPQSTLI